MDAGGLTFIRFSWNELCGGWIRVAGTEFGFCQQSWMGRFHCRGFSTFLNGGALLALVNRHSSRLAIHLGHAGSSERILHGVAQLRDPGLMAAGIYVPALYVPLLLVSHVLIFPITPTRRGMASSGLSLFHHPRAVAILMDGLLSAISPYGTKRKCRNARRRRIHRPLGGCARSLRRGAGRSQALEC
jgi:hypothetical protein